MKIVVSIEEDADLDVVQVELRVLGFDNFGKRFTEIQKEAFRTMVEGDQSPEGRAEREAQFEKNRENRKELMRYHRQKIADMSFGPGKLVALFFYPFGVLFQGILNVMVERAIRQKGVFDGLEIDPDADDGSWEHERDKITVYLADGKAWDDAAEEAVDRFLQSWPKLRPAVLEEMFGCYKEMYPQYVEMVPVGPDAEMLLPEPTSPSVIDDLCCICSLHLHENGSIGLCGDCSWDEEHGFGVRIENGRVTAAGLADEAY